jgi:uncharacterized membrane protein
MSANSTPAAGPSPASRRPRWLHPVNRKQYGEAPFGQRAAEKMQSWIGSWPFLIIQSIFLAFWVALNVVAVVRHWDPYPFILLNLALSFQAAYTGPILLIASNRTEAHDREIAEHTYEDTELLKRLLEKNTELTEAIHKLTGEMHAHILAAKD